MKFRPLSILTRLFPAKQVLIRQHGEIKVINLSTAKQSSLALLTVAVLGSLSGAAAYHHYQNTDITVAQEHVLKENAQLKVALANAELTEQNMLSQLELFEKRQQITHDLLASMPQSIMPNDNALYELSDPELPLSERLANMNEAQQSNFYVIDEIIAKREQQLSEAISRAGLPNTLMNELLAQSAELATAQGGPLELVDTDIDPQADSVVDKLLTLNQLETMLSQVPHVLPAADYYISSSFGLRKDPMNGRTAMHKGVDLAAWRNTEIFAPANGKVVRAGRNGGYGRFIEIEHANGFTTRFGHLNKINVKRGDEVTEGQVIALMGSTGRSTATHLHYEVLHNNKHINPVKITKALTDVFQQQRYTEE